MYTQGVCTIKGNEIKTVKFKKVNLERTMINSYNEIPTEVSSEDACIIFFN